ncbi:MAG: hypothetical protein DRH57_00320 [Candidatus Cloacimonadota bacterium]|nr:MAG: hypothetical protein DRH57_00320 [Candidatus Cloacimonadota bacterium]
MDLNELVNYYNQITNNISVIGNEIVNFSDEVKSVVVNTFTVPEGDDDPSAYDHFAGDSWTDFLDELENKVPDIDIDIPDFSVDSSDYKAIISSLNDALDQLFEEASSYVINLPSISIREGDDIPDYSFEYTYPENISPSIPELPTIPDPYIFQIPDLDIEVPDKETFSVNDLLIYINDYVAQIVEALDSISVNLDVSHDFNLDIDTSFYRDAKSLDDWKKDYDRVLGYQGRIDLNLIKEVVEGERLDSYVFSEEMIKSLADFSERVVRVAPLKHLKTLELEKELDQLSSEAVSRGFSDDVIDGSLYYDISLHKLKVKNELAEIKAKVLSEYGERVWKMVENKSALFNIFSSFLLLSYFSLVDMVSKIYMTEIRRVNQYISILERFWQLKIRQVDSLINKVKSNLSMLVADVRQKLLNETIDLDSEIFSKQALSLLVENVNQKIQRFLQTLKTFSTKVREERTKLDLYQIKSYLIQQQMRLETIKSDQYIVKNRNNLLTALRDITDMDILSSKLDFISRSQRAKLEVVRTYLDYISTALRKYNNVPDLTRRIENLRAEIDKFSIQSNAESRIKNLWLSTMDERAGRDTFDYRLFMKKALFDVDRAVDFALMHLRDRLNKDTTKYRILGEYYERNIRGVLSAAHTIVSMTDKLLEGG